MGFSVAGCFRINVESTIRNKIDQGLILTSEHHFSTKIFTEEREFSRNLMKTLVLNLL